MKDVIEMDERAVAAPQTSRAVATTTPSDLLRMAVEQGADMDKLEKLMALQERWEANQARKAYVEAMAEFKKNAPEIYKDKNVAFTGTSYNHATLGGICEVVIASLAKHGFSHRWDTKQPKSGMIIVTCILTHMLGHSEDTTLEAPPDNSGKKNGIQQIASTVTYLQRYTLLGACGLATKDLPDDDGRGAEGKQEAKDKPKVSIGGNRFTAAIDAVKAGTYRAAKIRAIYALTVDQETMLSDAERGLE
jgi:hypothetical protein